MCINLPNSVTVLYNLLAFMEKVERCDFILHVLMSKLKLFLCRYYSTSIFGQLGVSEYISTAIVGMINFLVTILAIFLVDKVW